MCPYLAAGDGRWRNAQASREHRCHAVDPAVVLAITKQRALCLTPEHRSCATFLAAREGADAVVHRSGRPAADLWPEVHTSPIVLEPAHARLGSLPVGGSRVSTQILLAGLMVVALLVLVLARLVAPPIDGPAPTGPAVTQPGGLGGASGSPRAIPVASTLPSPATTGSPIAPSGAPASAPVTPAPVPAIPPATPPPAVPVPSIATSAYTVREGDTMSSIASRFGTTVAVLAALNGISDPSLIRIGQVLRVPAS